jgi:hypothetical protein
MLSYNPHVRMHTRVNLLAPNYHLSRKLNRTNQPCLTTYVHVHFFFFPEISPLYSIKVNMISCNMRQLPLARLAEQGGVEMN